MQLIGSYALTFFGTVVVPALFTLSLVAFVWASAKYLIQGDHHEEEKEKAKLIMAYAVFMFWIMVFVWLVTQWLFGNLDQLIFVR